MNEWVRTVAEVLLNATWIGAAAHVTAWTMCRFFAAGPRLRGAVCLAALLAAAAAPWLQRVDWPDWRWPAAAEAPVEGFVATPSFEGFSGFETPAAPAGNGLWRIQTGPLVETAARVWLLGALAVTCHLGFGVAAALRLECRAQRPAGAWAERERRWTAGSARPARLLLSSDISAPVAVGWLRPAVLFPPALDATLSDAELERLWLHEAAHLERWDDWLVLLERLSLAPLWFHPSAWSLARRVAVEREMACDALAAERSGSRREFARTLTRLAELRIARGVAPALSIAGVSSLSRRIEMLLVDPPQTRGRLGRASLALAVTACTAAAAGVLTIGPLIGLAQTPPPPPAEPAEPAVLAAPPSPPVPAAAPSPPSPAKLAAPGAGPVGPIGPRPVGGPLGPGMVGGPVGPGPVGPGPMAMQAPPGPAPAPRPQPAPKPAPKPAPSPKPSPDHRELDPETQEELRNLSEEMRRMGEEIRLQVERDLQPLQEKMQALSQEMSVASQPFAQKMGELARDIALLQMKSPLTEEQEREIELKSQQIEEQSQELEKTMQLLEEKMNELELNVKPNEEAIQAIEQKMKARALEMQKRIEERMERRREQRTEP